MTAEKTPPSFRFPRLPAVSLAFLLAAGPVAAQEGTSAAQFLKLGVGARPVAMAGAFGALADDSSALYWNPAALSRLKAPEIGFMHSEYLESVRFDHLAFAQPVSQGALAFSVDYLSMDAIQKVDKTGLKLADSYRPSDVAATFGFGLPLFDVGGRPLRFGAAFKYLISRLDDKTANGAAADVGLLYVMDRLSIGASLHNMGSSLQFDREADPLPTLGRVGAAYSLSPHASLAVDVTKPRDGDAGVGVGGEITRTVGAATCALRGGYRTNKNKLGGLSGFSLGGGLAAGRLGFDYAWVPYGDLGQTHWFSLTMRFTNRGPAPQAPASAPATAAAGPPAAYFEHLAKAREAAAATDLDAAVLEYRQALALRADDPQVDIDLAEILMRQEKWEEARQEWLAASALMSQSDLRRITCTERLAAVSLKLDDRPQAKQFYLEAISLWKALPGSDAGAVDAYLGLAAIQESEAQLGIAIQNTKKAFWLESSDAKKSAIQKRLKALQEKVRSGQAPASPEPEEEEGGKDETKE